MTGRQVRIVAVLASPHPSRRTRAAVEELLDAVQRAGAACQLLETSDGVLQEGELDLLAEADGLIFASPVYRGDMTWAMKRLIDTVPQVHNGNGLLSGKPCVTVVVSGSPQHFMAGRHLRTALDASLGMHVLAPGLPSSPESPPDLAEQLGPALAEALVSMAGLVRENRGLQALRTALARYAG